MSKHQHNNPNRPPRLLLAVCIFLLASLYAVALAAQPNNASPGPWPQWRGPDGLGVSSETNLPEVWSENSPNIKWKTPIPGKGNSSPIVSGGRVILTTAYQSAQAGTLNKWIAIATCIVTLIFIATSVFTFLRKCRNTAKNRLAPSEHTSIGWFNTSFAFITSLAFLFLALLVTLGRSHSDWIFARIGLAVADMGHPDMEHLFSMDAGIRAAVWLTSGGIAALGLAVAVGRLKSHSIWRIIAAGAVLYIVFPLAARTPTDQWVEQIEPFEKIAFMLPAMIVAFWHLLNFLKIGPKPPPKSPQETATEPSESSPVPNPAKIRPKHQSLWQFGGPAALFSAALLVALSLLVFIPPNFFEAQLGMQRVVLCFDKETGKLLWEQPVFTAPAERKHSDSTYATPTPATDGTYIIVNFGIGAACLDFQGNIRWKKWDKGYIENSRYGASASPLITGDMAIIVQEAEEYSNRPTWIAAFDKRTSLTRWRINPENVLACYTTPLLYRSDGKEQLIIATLGNVSAFDIESGRFLWMERIRTEQLVASIARDGDIIAIGGGTWGPNATVVMRLAPGNGRTRPRTIWKSEQDPPGDSSPVIYAGKLFTISDKGKITCFDALTGDVFWNKRLKGGRYLSSLTAGDGKVYAFSTKGLTTVIAADAEFRIIAQNDLKGRCYASPAIADGQIFLRIGGYLHCIEKQRP